MSAVSEKSFAIVGLGAAVRDWLECAAELPELALAAGEVAAACTAAMAA